MEYPWLLLAGVALLQVVFLQHPALGQTPATPRRLNSYLQASQVPEINNQPPCRAPPFGVTDLPLHYNVAWDVSGDNPRCQLEAEYWAFTKGLYSVLGALEFVSNGTYTVGARIGADFGYIVMLPVGTYRVYLALRETYFSTTRSRVFTIYANDVPVYTDIDVYAETRARLKPFIVSFDVTLRDGALSLAFTAAPNKAGATVSAMGFFFLSPVDGPPPPIPHIYCKLTPKAPFTATTGRQFVIAQMNVGGPDACGFDADGDWSPKAPGQAWLTQFGGVTKTAYDPYLSVLFSWRYGQAFTYTFPAFGGDQLFFRFIFGEPYWVSEGARVLNLYINNVKVIALLDIIAHARYQFTPYIKEVSWTVPNQGATTVTVKLTTMRDNAVLSALEIYKVDGARDGLPVIAPITVNP